MIVLVSGASGFVGKYILDLLLEHGHEVHALSRSSEKNQKKYPRINWIQWDDSSHVADLSGIKKLDGVINLVGENLASKRWNNGQKKKIYNSRIDGTNSIFHMLEKAKLKPSVFVSTSAIGIYGDRGDESIDEESSSANDFLANLCVSWEKVVAKNKHLYGRSIIVRVGLVLGRDGGLSEKLLPIFKRGLGGKLGNGRFFMSWIHVKDLARIYVRALEDDKMKGVYNAVSPFPVRNSEFTNVFADALRKPAPFRVPKYALKLGMGEFGEYAVKGAKVLPKRLKSEDFHFLYPTVEVAIKDVVSKA